MSHARILLALALSTVPLAGACSHGDHHDQDHAAATHTSGDEHARVVARDTDHDGTRDTVAVQGDERPTAFDQGESSSDLEITRQIRAAVTDDSSLSFGARNCTIITNNGRVWLRGEATASESATIEQHANHVAGVVAVHNELETNTSTH